MKSRSLQYTFSEFVRNESRHVVLQYQQVVFNKLIIIIIMMK